jgi:4-hydroxybenzoate polyprenyltransferase
MIFLLIEAIRPKQWTKQIFVILPIISLGKEITLYDLWYGLIACALFTLASSIVYIFNDLNDIEKDRKDSVKANRPLASGRLPIRMAKVWVFFLLFLLIALTFNLSNNRIAIAYCLFAYLAVNFCYSFFDLKRFALPGIFLVAIGFPLRFLVGTLVLNLQFSFWGTALIMELALVLLAGKRYQSTKRRALVDKSSAKDSASNLDGDLIFWLLSLVAFISAFIATYANFIASPEIEKTWGGSLLLFTIIPLIMGLARYLEIVTHVKSFKVKDSTESLINDPTLIIIGLIYVTNLFFARIFA